MNWFRIYSDELIAFQHKNHISKRFHPYESSCEFYRWLLLFYNCLQNWEFDKRVGKLFKRVEEGKAEEDYKNYKLNIQPKNKS
jgi:hypothetical protein